MYDKYNKHATNFHLDVNTSESNAWNVSVCMYMNNR